MQEVDEPRPKTPQGNRFPVLPLGAVLILASGAMLLYLAFGRVQAIPDLIQYQDVGRGHDNAATFESSALPPAGGVHHDTFLNCGIYAEEVPTGQAVHSLEHGAVWLTYRKDLSDQQVEMLRNLARDEDYVILSPYVGQVSPIVLTAWAVQLEVMDADDERIAQFVEQYQLGPIAPEPGAPCSGGEGEPLE